MEFCRTVPELRFIFTLNYRLPRSAFRLSLPVYSARPQSLSSVLLVLVQERFDVERLQDQAQISELLQDARAVEVASSQPKQPSITSTKSSKGSTSKTRQEGGAVEYGSLEGGDESFAGVSGNNMAVGSSGSNAYVEPSEVREDPDFISTDKVRLGMVS